MYGDQALKLLCSKEYDHLNYVYDIGSGAGEQAEEFRAKGKTVFELDSGHSNEVRPWRIRSSIEEFNERISSVDLIWCCHCLEHVKSVHRVLDKFYVMLVHEGVLAITVPPAKPEIVGGHLTIWNAGLLLYNLVVAGFDCRKARIKTYGYNISVIVTKNADLKVPVLANDSGDIERLAHLFPPELNVRQGFDGNIAELNWR